MERNLLLSPSYDGRAEAISLHNATAAIAHGGSGGLLAAKALSWLYGRRKERSCVCLNDRRDPRVC